MLHKPWRLGEESTQLVRYVFWPAAPIGIPGRGMTKPGQLGTFGMGPELVERGQRSFEVGRAFLAAE